MGTTMIQGGGGQARIYGPNSALLTEDLPESEEGIVIATVDLAAIDLAKTPLRAAASTHDRTLPNCSFTTSHSAR